MLASRQRERVDHALHPDERMPGAPEFLVQEADVESGIVNDEPVITHEGQKLLDDRREDGLVRQELIAEPVDTSEPLESLEEEEP